MSWSVFFKICSSTDVAALEEISSDTVAHADIAKKAEQLLKAGFRARFEAAALEHGRVRLLELLSKPVPGKRAADRWLGLWATIALHRKYVLSDGYKAYDEQMLLRSLDENLTAIASGRSSKQRSPTNFPSPLFSAMPVTI